HLLARAELEAKPERLAPVRSIEFRYPDQDAFPPAQLNFDAEALVWARGRLWIFTKHRADTQTTLYRFGDLERTNQVLERVSQFDVDGARHPYGGMVSGADVDDNESRLALLTYHALFIFPLDPTRSDDLLYAQPIRVEFVGGELAQVEGVVFQGEEVVIANEAGHVFRLPIAGLEDGGHFDGTTLRPPRAD